MYMTVVLRICRHMNLVRVLQIHLHVRRSRSNYINDLREIGMSVSF